jgi:hypothetical protein
MTSALDVTSGPTDSLPKVSRWLFRIVKATHRAFASNDNHFRVLSESLTVQFPSLDTSTNRGDRAIPVPGSGVLLSKCNLLETVSIDDQGSVSSRTAHEIMTSVSTTER